MAEIYSPFDKFCSFQSLVSLKQLREIDLQIVGSILFDWCAETLMLFSGYRGRFILTNG